MTTIVSVRRGNQVALAGDGQVSLGNTVMKGNASKVRRLYRGKVLAGFAGLVGSILFFLWPYLGALGRRLNGLRERIPSKIDGILQRVLNALSLLRKGPMMVLKLLAMAMLGHCFPTMAAWMIGMGVGGASQVDFQEYLLATQLSNLVGAVPLTPGGLGGRDLALSFLLKLAGATESSSGAIPLVVTGLIVSWSAVGGLALVWEKKHLPEQAGQSEKDEVGEPQA